MVKNLFFAACGLLYAATVCAQPYEVGSAFVKDGVPCVIISVDDDGQHGLAMTCVPTLGELQNAKKTGEHKWYYVYRKLKGKDRKLQAQYRTEYYNMYKCDTIRARTSGISSANKISTSFDGKENMQNVIDFCAEKDIEMAMYFPEYYWAQTLGDDWFIPGAAEMEMLVNLLGYETFGYKYRKGIMKDHKYKMQIWEDFMQSVQNLNEDALLFTKVMAPYKFVLVSSTWVNNGKNATPLYWMELIQQATGKHWYDMTVGGTGYVCAVCEF